MSPEIEREQRIFFEAVQLTDPAERKKLLDQACGGDRTTRANVEELLAANAIADPFFAAGQMEVQTIMTEAGVPSTAKSDASIPPVAEEQTGAWIGRYQVVKKIGEGGSGSVYLADQFEPVRRQVALKIIKLGMDTKSVIARFRAEQQTLALMEHPNIARVLDAGATQTGRPFFVMELVRGERITAYCDKRGLSTSQRLDLFMQVCHTIQHAHHKGILHRDVKPSNILVSEHDGVALPKVIDFGIAKAMEGKLTEDTLSTAQGLMIGTPAYMSPEQAQMRGRDVDVRSDIYSLGVLLYELLTSKPPFEQRELLAAGVDEMRRILREQEPPKPSAKLASLTANDLTEIARCRQLAPHSLRSELTGDLDWIVMKALEKEPERRYQTAHSLASDVQRYLDNEPVLARPPSRLYRFKKLVMRNRLVFASGSLAAIALAIGMVTAFWMYLQERNALQRLIQSEQQRATVAHEVDRLREAAEDNQNASKALQFYRKRQFPEASAALTEVKKTHANNSYATMYRNIGDWNAANGDWPAALHCFDLLYQVNVARRIDFSVDDQRYPITLVDQGRFAEFVRLRTSLIKREAKTQDHGVAASVLRICLLTPADTELLGKLKPLERLVNDFYKTAGRQTFEAQFSAYTLALLSYRKGDYGGCLKLCDEAAHSGDGSFAFLDASVQLTKAMAYARLGETDKAEEQVLAFQDAVEDASRPDAKRPDKSYWFDWACARIHLREAATLIETTPSPK